MCTPSSPLIDPGETRASGTEAVINVIQDLITRVPDAWPWWGGLLALGLPGLVRELRRLIYARTVSRLGRAVIDNPTWSDERFKLVIRLIHDVDRNSAPKLVASDRPPGESNPRAPRPPDES